MSNSHSKSKFCKKCGTETERNSRGECRPCMRARSAAWQAANPEKVKTMKAEYRAANPDKIKASYASWASANPEKIKTRNTNYHEANREKERESGAAYRAVNTEKLFNLQKGKCPVCKDSLSLTKPRSPLDHIVAISNGGSNTDDNIQMLCRTCNQQKHAKHPVDFMQSKGFLL